jgi:acyl CoA:acetate/3-ketoacid CoA transferase alpha subunit
LPVPALKLDVGYFHCQRADEEGNDLMWIRFLGVIFCRKPAAKSATNV